jgi:hypothetical protein
MNEISNNAPGSMFPTTRDSGIDARIFWTMGLATVFAVIASLTFAPWRITTGLLLGGLLALLNHRWLSNSTAAAFAVVVEGTRPKLKVAQYILRYFVIATVVFIAYKLNVVSLTATIIGLCSFVVALFAEACREFYLAIIHREEIS